MATAPKTPPRSKPAPSAKRAAPRTVKAPAEASITLSSKTYSSWSLRGWLMAKLAGLSFDEVMVSIDDANARKEILLLSPSILVPCLTHGDIKVWDTLAIGEYLNEIKPDAGLLPADAVEQAVINRVPERFRELNTEAFRLGRRLAAEARDGKQS